MLVPLLRPSVKICSRRLRKERLGGFLGALVLFLRGFPVDRGIHRRRDSDRAIGPENDNEEVQRRRDNLPDG